jgi:hypothetical protein
VRPGTRVDTLRLHLRADHIAQARALRRLSEAGEYICICTTCPLALMAREFFGRPCRASGGWVAVVDDGGEILWQFEHDGAEVVFNFDCGGPVLPQPITLTRI